VSLILVGADPEGAASRAPIKAFRGGQCVTIASPGQCSSWGCWLAGFRWLVPRSTCCWGTWDLDVSKSSQPNPPKAVTIVLEEAGDGRYRMSVDILGSEGTKTHAEGTFSSDGTPSRAFGSADVDLVSMTMPSTRVLVMGAAYAGHPANTRVFSLADDRRHMIETIVSHRPDATPTTRINIWNRR
jgi:hypothetical protein